jgi:transposase
VLLAEIGRHRSRFPSAEHGASGAGLYPGYDESAGTRQGGKIRKSNRWRRQLFIEAAHGVAHHRQT